MTMSTARFTQELINRDIASHVAYVISDVSMNLEQQEALLRALDEQKATIESREQQAHSETLEDLGYDLDPNKVSAREREIARLTLANTALEQELKKLRDLVKPL